MADTSNRVEIYCGNNMEMFDTWGNSNVPFSPVQYICTGSVRFVKAANAGVAMVITYNDGLLASSTYITNTTNSTSTGNYNGPNFQEWLFVACVLLFFISLGTWRRILSPFLTPVR